MSNEKLTTIKLRFRWIEHGGHRYVSLDDMTRTLDELASHLDVQASAAVRGLALKLTTSTNKQSDKVKP